MSAMSQLVYDVQQEVEKGDLSFQDIAYKYNIPVAWVQDIAELLQSAEESE